MEGKPLARQSCRDLHTCFSCAVPPLADSLASCLNQYHSATPSWLTFRTWLLPCWSRAPHLIQSSLFIWNCSDRDLLEDVPWPRQPSDKLTHLRSVRGHFISSTYPQAHKSQPVFPMPLWRVSSPRTQNPQDFLQGLQKYWMNLLDEPAYAPFFLATHDS